MTPEEAYKTGFLLRCAEEGLTPDAIEQRIRNAYAFRKVAEGGGMLSNTVGKLTNFLLNAGLVSSIALPLGVGMGGGYLAAKLQDDAVDPRDLRKAEEIAAYNRAIRRLSRLRPPDEEAEQYSG